jgi:hypothetical protein
MSNLLYILIFAGESMKMTRFMPMLPVTSLATSIRFYSIPGFVVEQRRDDPDGNRLWAGQRVQAP